LRNRQFLKEWEPEREEGYYSYDYQLKQILYESLRIERGEQKQQGNGYMTEALRVLIDYAFTDLRLHRVEDMHMSSMRVIIDRDGTCAIHTAWMKDI
jgi:hypothetical protein